MRDSRNHRSLTDRDSHSNPCGWTDATSKPTLPAAAPGTGPPAWLRRASTPVATTRARSRCAAHNHPGQDLHRSGLTGKLSGKRMTPMTTQTVCPPFRSSIAATVFGAIARAPPLPPATRLPPRPEVQSAWLRQEPALLAALQRKRNERTTMHCAVVNPEPGP